MVVRKGPLCDTLVLSYDRVEPIGMKESAHIVVVLVVGHHIGGLVAVGL